ncbi:MAG TPA: hypothetical protein VNN08_09755 [Thermoanaerobaculia bacterium]|nr:hypothetical protein [Thermoanaerobaculia bacterium]
MKRLLISFAVALFAVAALGQTEDRDVLITPSGTVYTVETVTPDPSGAIDASRTLVLTVQNGSDVSHIVVPDSTTSGFHFGGGLAYDTDTDTLFVVWTHTPNGMSSELLLTSLHAGTWQPAVSIDNERYRLRSNLRLGMTRRVSQLLADGTSADAPALLLHVVWWEDSGTGEEARYALLTIDKGALVLPIETHSLGEFVAASDNGYTSVDPTFNKEILRHPAIVSPPMQSAVEIIFGDTHTNVIHGVTLRPVIDLHPQAEHRIHIPVGIGAGGGIAGGGAKALSIGAPSTFSADWKGPVTVLQRGDRLAFANAGDTSLNYITYSSGAWTGVKSIAINSHFSAEAALAALDRMVSSEY